jgi:glutamyl-tRNA synthetase
LLHVGHARTFWTAYTRARPSGQLILRNEDLDPQRSKPEYVAAMIEDLHWLGIEWDEGPDVGGLYEPYAQSERRENYLWVWKRLLERGFLYPCTCSRRELQGIAQAPHEVEANAWQRLTRVKFERDEGPMYPGTCRPKGDARELAKKYASPAGVNWRFRVPDGKAVEFDDGHFGPQRFVAGCQEGADFGDFPVWRRDDVPAYQLAVVTDDGAMKMTEVVRGADLLLSTARQILIYEALEWVPPHWYHCPLVLDERGERLAKRSDAVSIRALREQRKTPAEVRGGVTASAGQVNLELALPVTETIF